MDKIEILLEWENNVSFTVTAKLNSDPATTVIEVEENGHIAEMWRKISEVPMEYLKHELARIGNDMKKV